MIAPRRQDLSVSEILEKTDDDFLGNFSMPYGNEKADTMYINDGKSIDPVDKKEFFHGKGYLNPEEATYLYTTLLQDGKSFSDSTKTGIFEPPVDYLASFPKIYRRVFEILSKFRKDHHIDYHNRVFGTNVLYYPNEEAAMPSHIHPRSNFIISLGSTRVLTVDGKDILFEHGDVIWMGELTHELKHSKNAIGGRIAIVIHCF